MYGIFTYIYPKNQLNVRKYTISMDGMGYDWMPRDVSPLIYSKKRRVAIFGMQVPGTTDLTAIRAQKQDRLPCGFLLAHLR